MKEIKTFWAWAKTNPDSIEDIGGVDIGRVKMEIETDLPLKEGDVLTIEEVEEE